MSQPLLPVEIVGQIIEQVSNDGNAFGVYSRLATLRNCRSICHTMNEIVLPHIYRHAPFNGPHSFAKFLDELKTNPGRGQLVRTLDFSAFTSVGLGRSRSCNTKMFFLTASTLDECLKLCPNVEEVFLAESLELDIDANVFRTLFVELKQLKALDFCASDAPEFVQAFQSFLSTETTWRSNLMHLSFHNCSTLPASFFEALLPRFDNLQRLDLYNTQVSGAALLSLAPSCRLSTLNLGQCTRITANALVNFMTAHPASTTLRQLNLLYSWNKTHPLSIVPQALDVFVQALPRQLEVLDLSGCELDLQHLAFLPPKLIELGVHDIDIGEHYSDAVAGDVSDALTTVLSQLRYLLLTQNVISSETKFAAILVRLFPNIAIIESPGFSRLPYLNSLSYARISGIGRRDWITRKGFGDAGVEKSGSQYHPRKSNMSLSLGVPRGIYDYYSYRV